MVGSAKISKDEMCPVGMAERQIVEFQTLVPGWHYGSGVPVKPFTAHAAEVAIGALRAAGFGYLRAFPGVDGEVLIKAEKDGRTIQFEILDDSDD